MSKYTPTGMSSLVEERGKDKGGDKGVSFANDSDSDTSSIFSAQTTMAINVYTSTVSGSPKISSTHSSVKSDNTRKRNSPVNALAAKRSMECSELIGLPELILTTSGSSSWSERQEALKTITGMIINYWEVMLDAGKLVACVDCLLERLEDGSVKVVHCALACLLRVYEESPGSLSHSPAIQLVVISAFHLASSSSNRYLH